MVMFSLETLINNGNLDYVNYAPNVPYYHSCLINGLTHGYVFLVPQNPRAWGSRCDNSNFSLMRKDEVDLWLLSPTETNIKKMFFFEDVMSNWISTCEGRLLFPSIDARWDGRKN